MRVKKQNKEYLKLLSIFACTMFYVVPVYALIITEVNFDPAGSDTDREWVEIYNDTNTNIDLTSYKFYEANVNHGIDVLSVDKNISAGEYVVLVQDINKFKADNPTYSGKIFKSSFSLSNTGESLGLKDTEGNTINTFSYQQSQTGAKDGETIIFDGTNYLKAIATPGAGNIINTGGTSTTTGTTTATTTQTTGINTATTTETSFSSPIYYYRSYFPESVKIYVYAGENKVSISGAQTTFEANCVNGDKKTQSDAHFFWSFGDVATGEGKKVSHTYKYPGEYTVNVECFANGNKGEDKIYVKVIQPNLKIKINIINEEKTIEINNGSANEVDVGGFIIKTEGGEFKKEIILPNKLLILPKKYINLPQEILLFATGTSYVSLNSPNGKFITEYFLDKKDTVNLSLMKKVGTLIATTSVGIQVYTKEEYEKKLALEKLPVVTAKKTNIPKVKNSNTNSTDKTEISKNFQDAENSHIAEENSDNIFTIRQEEGSFARKIYNFFR